MTATATADLGRQVELILAELESLPTLPAIAMRLLKLTSASDTNVREVVELIQADPAMTAKILSLVRRVSAGVRSDAATIEKAVPLVGFDVIRTAVLTLKVIETFEGGGGQTAFPRSEFWKHSLAVACTAKLVAEAHAGCRVDPEEAFVCGLLHDVGKAAFDACLPKSYDRVIRRVDATRGDIREVEQGLLGLDHTLAGRRLALRWGLPTSIVECVWLHHQLPEALPGSLDYPEHVRLIHLADLIVREQRIGYSGNFRFHERPWPVAERLGFTRKAFEFTVRKLAGTIEERAGLIGLDDLTSDAVYVSALGSANEELGRLNVALTEKNRGLEVRGRYFEAMVRLGTQRAGQTDVAATCLAVADALRRGLLASRVLVFTPPGEDKSVHVGLVAPDDARAEVLSLTDTQTDDGVDQLRPRGGFTRAVLMPAGPEVAAILEHYQVCMGSDPLWTLALGDGRHWVGSAIVAAGPDEVANRNRETDELDAFLVAAGLSLGAARERSRTIRLTEELAQANQDLLAAQSQLLRDRSLHMVAEMASGAAHELNNPLAVISGRSQILLRSELDERVRDVLELIHDQAHRCSGIVSELMDFAKPAPPRKQRVRLAALLTDLRDRWLQGFGLESGRIVLEAADPDVTVDADPDQLADAFDALVANAVDAISPTDGKLVINCPLPVTDDIRTIEFADTGCGMDADVLSHAMDPFFSHRTAGRGRGMGLPRAYRLIEINGGNLHIDSTPGQGTHVVVTLPAASSEPVDTTDG